MHARSVVLAASMVWLGCGGTGGASGTGVAPAEGSGSSVMAPASTPAEPPPASIEPEAAPGASAAEAPGDLPLAGPSPAPGPSVANSGLAEASGADAGAASTPEPGTAEPPPPGELAPLTIWIAGDSTVANGNTPCPRGWGGAFAPHFGDAVRVVNSAAGGRSVQTWLYEVLPEMGADGECALTRDASGAPVLQARWQAMLDGMQPGDYLFVQFGINDGDRTCDRHVGIPAFEAALEMMARAALDRGAHPVFLTPVSMIACDGATARGSRGEYVPATLRAGEAAGATVIDLHARSVALYQELGFCPVPGGDVSAETGGPVGEFFCDDHTHFSSSGAARMAELVSAALVEQQIPLAAYLR